MHGMMEVEKRKMKDQNKGGVNNALKGGFSDVVNFGGSALNKLRKKPYFAIKKGSLFQYSYVRSREAEDTYLISKITAIGVSKDDPLQFTMIYKNFYCIFNCDNKDICQKWVNSIKYVQEEGEFSEEDDFFASQHAKDHRYSQLDIYHKVTGKSCFKDYAVLMEAFEQKSMLALYIKSMQHLD